jgi:hypothetical protein
MFAGSGRHPGSPPVRAVHRMPAAAQYALQPAPFEKTPAHRVGASSQTS